MAMTLRPLSSSLRFHSGSFVLSQSDVFVSSVSVGLFANSVRKSGF